MAIVNLPKTVQSKYNQNTCSVKFWLYYHDLKLVDAEYNFFKPFAFLNNEIDYKGKLWVQSYLECLFKGKECVRAMMVWADGAPNRDKICEVVFDNTLNHWARYWTPNEVLLSIATCHATGWN